MKLFVQPLLPGICNYKNEQNNNKWIGKCKKSVLQRTLYTLFNEKTLKFI